VTTDKITTYKGFDKNLACRGFQYEIGKTYTMEGAKACEYGFHACEYPLDVFGYYAPAGNKFAIVEQSGTLSRHNADTKVASSVIAVSAEIDIAGMVKAAIGYTVSKCDPVKAKHSTGTRSASSATGYRSASSATGDQSASSATGYRSASLSTGYLASASVEKDNSHSVAIAAGELGKAKGAVGCAIVLVNRCPETGAIRHIKAAKVGEEGIKAGVFYMLNDNGEIVESV